MDGFLINKTGAFFSPVSPLVQTVKAGVLCDRPVSELQAVLRLWAWEGRCCGGHFRVKQYVAPSDPGELGVEADWF